jgi:hypothetical protein
MPYSKMLRRGQIQILEVLGYHEFFPQNDNIFKNDKYYLYTSDSGEGSRQAE